MANSGDKLTALFRSLSPDDEKFHSAEKEMAKKGEQRWPLFKSLSLARPEPTPELSEQERLLWSRQEKSVVAARKPALSLPVINEKLTFSLDKIANKVGMGAEQSIVRSEQSREHSGSIVGRRDESQQLASNNDNDSNVTPTFSIPVPIAPTAPTPPFLKPPIVALNLEVEPRSFERPAVLPTVSKRDLPDIDHADDSLQSLFSRIQGKEKVAAKPTEKRSSFFDRLRKR